MSEPRLQIGRGVRYLRRFHARPGGVDADIYLPVRAPTYGSRFTDGVIVVTTRP